MPKLFILALTAICCVAAAHAQQPADQRQFMLDQLGVKSLRPGADPNDAATFDEAEANRYADSIPPLLVMADGTPATTAEHWRQRREELLELFAREIYGRVPADAPKVTWEVTSTEEGQTGDVPTVTRKLVGRVDNSAYPALEVNIEASYTVPTGAAAAPLMLSFEGWFAERFGGRRAPGGAAPGPQWTDVAISKGWGHGWINPNSIQPDKNDVQVGVIGLANRGEPRKPDDWGALRAWAWGVSQLIDYFQEHPEAGVDATKVGIEGVSRYGKAALVAQAFDERVAVALVASSGQGGAKLHRRLFGERVENLAGGFPYWMAGNYLKYAADEPKRTAADLPVDSHQLLALCAPRPCFVSYGTVEGGDPHWVDARGSYMACLLASPAYELAGAKGPAAPTSDRGYLNETLPPVGQLVGGQLAWRQHAGGHAVAGNWPAFFDWVSAYIEAPPLDNQNSR